MCEKDEREGRPTDGDFDPLVTFLHDVPPEVVAHAGEHVKVQSGTPFEKPWPLEAWPDVPTRFLLCRDDRFFPAEFMRRVVRTVGHHPRRDEQRSPARVWRTRKNWPNGSRPTAPGPAPNPRTGTHPRDLTVSPASPAGQLLHAGHARVSLQLSPCWAAPRWPRRPPCPRRRALDSVTERSTSFLPSSSRLPVTTIFDDNTSSGQVWRAKRTW